MDLKALAIFLLGACVSVCSACSCMSGPYGPEMYCSYDVIFRGMALAEHMERKYPLDHSDPWEKYSPHNNWVYAVRVDQAIKMSEEMKKMGVLEIRSSTQDNLCGTRLALDVDALFFARVNYEGKLETGLCDPNAAWGMLDDWTKELITEHVPDYCANQGRSPPPPPTTGGEEEEEEEEAPPPPPPNEGEAPSPPPTEGEQPPRPPRDGNAPLPFEP